MLFPNGTLTHERLAQRYGEEGKREESGYWQPGVVCWDLSNDKPLFRVDHYIGRHFQGPNSVPGLYPIESGAILEFADGVYTVNL